VGWWMSFVLKEKLKVNKLMDKEECGGMEERVKKLVDEINGLDEKWEEGVLSDLEVTIWKSKFEDLWRLLKAKDLLLVQRLRSSRLKEGDANSKFFHKCLKLRSSRNDIKALRENDGWVG